MLGGDVEGTQNVLIEVFKKGKGRKKRKKRNPSSPACRKQPGGVVRSGYLVVGMMPAGDGPGLEQVLEARVVVTFWVSGSCCGRESPPQPPEASPDHPLGSGLLILSLLSLGSLCQGLPADSDLPSRLQLGLDTLDLLVGSLVVVFSPRLSQIWRDKPWRWVRPGGTSCLCSLGSGPPASKLNWRSLL